MKIQHKRSNQLDGSSAKEPTSDFMEYGELAVNFNENDPAIFLKDSGDNVIRIAGAGANGNIEIPDAGSDPHQPGTSDDRYVEVTGDNMTGDLTIGPEGGPEVIKLADSGSITAGDSTFAVVRVGTGNAVMSETSLNQSGSLRLTAGSADEYIPLNLTDSSIETVGKFTTFGDNCKLDLGKGIPTIILNSNGGSANFAGTVNAATAVLTDNRSTQGVGYYSLYVQALSDPADSSSALEEKASISNDGSATFAGPVKHSGYDSDYGCNVYTDGANQGGMFAKATSANGLLPSQGSAFAATWDGADVARIRYDGSATFTGPIISGGPSVFTGDDKGSFIGYEGNSGFCSGATSSAIRVWTEGNSTPTVDILGNGSASFAGDILTTGADDGSYNKLFGSYGVQIDSGTASGGYLIQGLENGTETSRINSDGSSIFAGRMQVNTSASLTLILVLLFRCQQGTPQLGGWIRLADANTGVARSQWGYTRKLLMLVTFDLVGSGTGLRVRNSNSNLDSCHGFSITLNSQTAAPSLRMEFGFQKQAHRVT